MQPIFWSLKEGQRNGIIQLHLLRSYWSHFLGLQIYLRFFVPFYCSTLVNKIHVMFLLVFDSPVINQRKIIS